MPIPDRHKHRREYFRKKAVGFSTGFGAALAAMAMAAITGILIVLGLWACIGSCVYGNGFSLLVGSGLLIVACFLGRATLKSGHFAERQVGVATLLPYVPPVTPDTLPAEEVLVRGAEEPTQEQSGVLLRATEDSADSPAEQLLRAATGTNHRSEE